jgi:hypothetical protein
LILTTEAHLHEEVKAGLWENKKISRKGKKTKNDEINEPEENYGQGKLF